jgi:hypothetical protein
MRILCAAATGTKYSILHAKSDQLHLSGFGVVFLQRTTVVLWEMQRCSGFWFKVRRTFLLMNETPFCCCHPGMQVGGGHGQPHMGKPRGHELPPDWRLPLPGALFSGHPFQGRQCPCALWALYAFWESFHINRNRRSMRVAAHHPYPHFSSPHTVQPPVSMS